MSDHTLSQDEIDALLSGQCGSAAGSSAHDDDTEKVDGLFDAIVESLITNVLDRTGTQPIANRSPTSRHRADALFPLLQGRVLITADFHGPAQGIIVFSLTPEHAARFVDMLGVDASDDSGRSRVADTFIRATADGLASVVNAPVQGALLAFQQVNDDEGRNRFLDTIDHDVVYQQSATLTIADLKMDFSILIPASFAAHILGQPVGRRDPSVEPYDPPLKYESVHGEEAKHQVMSQALGQSTSNEQGNIDLLLDVQLQVTVELGRTRMPIKDLLALGKGSVIELDKLAGEPVEVFVNGRLLARGEVVTIDDHFGVKITDIVQPSDRVSGLT